MTHAAAPGHPGRHARSRALRPSGRGRGGSPGAGARRGVVRAVPRPAAPAAGSAGIAVSPLRDGVAGRVGSPRPIGRATSSCAAPGRPTPSTRCKNCTGRAGAPSQLFFIIGVDAFADVASWRAYPDVLEAANFVVISRAGRPAPQLAAHVAGAGRLASPTAGHHRPTRTGTHDLPGRGHARGTCRRRSSGNGFVTAKASPTWCRRRSNGISWPTDCTGAVGSLHKQTAEDRRTTDHQRSSEVTSSAKPIPEVRLDRHRSRSRQEGVRHRGAGFAQGGRVHRLLRDLHRSQPAADQRHRRRRSRGAQAGGRTAGDHRGHRRVRMGTAGLLQLRRARVQPRVPGVL